MSVRLPPSAPRLPVDPALPPVPDPKTPPRPRTASTQSRAVSNPFVDTKAFAPPPPGPKRMGTESSLYGDAYDGKVMSDSKLHACFHGGACPSPRERVSKLELRPDDIARARELGLIDQTEAQALANQSLDALEAAGLTEVPREIRYTQAGPFYFRLGKDDTATLDRLKAAIGLDPSKKGSQRTNSEDQTWDYAALAELQKEGALQVVDRFKQPVDILSKTKIDGEDERNLNLRLSYRAIDYEDYGRDGDANRINALDVEEDGSSFIMIEAWNQDLSAPKPGVVYNVPAYEMPRFNEGRSVDPSSDPTDLWRFETLPDAGPNEEGRIGFVSGKIELVLKPEEQVEDTAAWKKTRGWRRNQGMEKVRNEKQQSAAGNKAMIEAGMRDPITDGVPYHLSQDRYNGGHVIAASLGGFGETLNVTAQAEGNNQDRNVHKVEVEGELKRFGGMNETWHDVERHLKGLADLGDSGLTLDQMEAQGLVLSEGIRAAYAPGEKIEFDVHTTMRMYYEDEARSDEDPSTRHNREVGRFTMTELRDKRTGEPLASLAIANYNIGGSDRDFEAKRALLLEKGFLDEDGGYADDVDMSSLASSWVEVADTKGGGTLDETLPTETEIKDLVNSDEFKDAWARNVPE